MIQELFLSKKNISMLNRIILDRLDLKNKPKDMKKHCVQVLINNMKKIYKSIDKTRISDDNINSVLKQYNNWCMKVTITDLKQNISNKPSRDNGPQISNIQFQRDIKSNPKSKVTYFDRPMATGGSMFQNKREQNISNNFNKAFEPLMPRNNQEAKFNQYQFHGDTKKDVQRNLDSLMAQRSNEVQSRQRPKTPDFIRKNRNNSSDNSMNRSNIDVPRKRSGKIDFTTPIPQNELYQGLVGTSGGDDNLCSLDNIDKPLTNIQIEEDTTSFDDRLKRLQMDRDNIKINTNNNDNIYNPRDMLRDSKRFQNNNNVGRNLNPPNNNFNNNRNLNPSNNNYQPNTYNIPQNLNKPVINNYDSSQVNKLQNLVEQLNSELQRLKDENNKLKENHNYSSGQYQSIDQARQELAVEYQKLEQQNNMIGTNLQILQQKEAEIDKRQEDILQIISSHNTIFNSKDYQVIIDSRLINETSNDYVYKLPMEIENVYSIELISYSIPSRFYNINNFNNTLKYKIYHEIENNDEMEEDEKEIKVEIIEKELKIKNGRYNIDKLIKNLNENDDKILFEKDDDDYIHITCENNFDIISTILTERVLGFVEECKDSKEYVSDRVWDLRELQYTLLSLPNIDSENVFAVLDFNGKSTGQIEFEKSIQLSELHIKFTDFNNIGIDFNNMFHMLHFKIRAYTKPINIHQQLLTQ